MKVAIERHSSVLASNAIHHRVDSWTGVVTLLAVVLANFVENAAWLDPVGGLLISMLVVKAGAENTISAIRELIDRGLDDEIKTSVKFQVNKALGSITEGHEVELRLISGTKSGQNFLIDLELAVPGTWTVEDVREIESGVREQIGSHIRGAKRVRVRFVSRDAPPPREFDEFVSGEVSPEVVESDAAEEEEAEAHEHDHEGHSHSHSNGHSNGHANGNGNSNGQPRKRH